MNCFCWHWHVQKKWVLGGSGFGSQCFIVEAAEIRKMDRQFKEHSCQSQANCNWRHPSLKIGCAS